MYATASREEEWEGGHETDEVGLISGTKHTKNVPCNLETLLRVRVEGLLG